MMADTIYLDNNASTAPDPLVIDAVVECMRDLVANPSSAHFLGGEAAAAVERAREQVASLVGCLPGAVIFGSGATEADGLAIRGLWDGSRAAGSSRDTIIVGATEHPAVLEAARSLAYFGARVLEAPVDARGVVDLEALKALSNERTLLISIMAANNETGTIAPLANVVSIAKEVGAYLHSDATQMIGRLPFNMTALEIDLVSLSSHKMHGPKGVGALAVRRGVPVGPQIYGGGQERGLRSGTLNTPGIVGLGVAAELARSRFEQAHGIAHLRDLLQAGLQAALDGVTLNGHPTHRLPNTVNLRFAGADADAVLASLRTVACSSGSACSSAVPAPSHALVAMGLDHEAAGECLRFSLSRTTTAAEIEAAVAEIVEAVAFVRQATAVEVG